MAKNERKVIIVGDQLPEPDVLAMARVIVRLARQQVDNERVAEAALAVEPEWRA